MELADLTALLRDNSIPVVFINVLLQQIGLPIPVIPTLLLAGALSASVGSVALLLVAAVLGSVLADMLWFYAGRKLGYRVLSLLCKLSLNPASCISQSENRFARWGMASLIVAKFIPGFSIVAPPIAGALGMSATGFMFSAGAGAALWAGSALYIGWSFNDKAPDILIALDAHTGKVLIVAAIAFALWFLWKLGQRYRFKRKAKLTYISPLELKQLKESAQPLLLLDLRSNLLVNELGPVDGAVLVGADSLLDLVAEWPKANAVVTFCACPQDASAVMAANTLKDAGYLDVRPVAGGFELLRTVL